MRNIMRCIVLLSILFPAAAWAQLPPSARIMYVAHKPGLSIRETPDVKAKVLAKIPYATKVTLGDENADTVTVTTDGFTSIFNKVTYNNKTGYIIGAYLLPVPPPKATVKTMTDYLAQLSPKSGPQVEVKNGTMNNIYENGSILKKQLYKNATEHHQFTAYEYNSDTWILPNFSIQQAWVLLRLIPDWNQVASEKDEFPTTSKRHVKNNLEFDVKVEKNSWGGPYSTRRITIEYSDGASYVIEISTLEGQVVIFSGGGV
jgi:uncharacterized protein YgiM (DUF1202 family)